jgi:hypothetical protein
LPYGQSGLHSFFVQLYFPHTVCPLSCKLSVLSLINQHSAISTFNLSAFSLYVHCTATLQSSL